MVIDIIFIIIGFALLIKGADFLVDGASSIAKRFHIPEIVIGLTIVSVGTSMPELVVSLTSALDGHADIALGNVIGSNMANMFLILGTCAVIKPLIFKRETRLIENPITIFVTILLFSFCLFGNDLHTITRTEGIILFICCIGFIIYNIVMARKGEEFDREDGIVEVENTNTKSLKIFKSIIYIVIGILGLKFGGDFVVNSAVNIATALNISEKIISLTIIAFSTSLPELITSITATRKGDVDMAIGNIIGSQIFNIVLILGISSIINPISYSLEYNGDMILLIIGTITLGLFPYIGKKNEMTKINGSIFVVTYIAYMFNIVLRNA